MTRSQWTQRIRQADPRHGALLVLSVAAVTAFAVLITLLVPPAPTAYGAGIALTGPVVRPDENPLFAIQEVLAQQSAALLRGDRDGYLQAIAADDAPLREQAGRRFDSLTALRVRRWTMETADLPSRTDDTWRVPVDVGYCFADDDCTPVRLRVATKWSVVHGRLRLSGHEQTHRPWDATTLAVKEGGRVTVAGPAGDAAGDPVVLDRVLRAAEAATVTDDRFAASFDGPPKRYFVYVAGEEQWKDWYAGGAANAGAYTIPLQPGAADVVVDHKTMTDSWLPTLITHEFAHVVTLGGIAPPGPAWWLTEGVAAYIANGEGGELRNDLPSVRRYLAAGKWDGSLVLTRPPADATFDETAARYGIALLAVTYLAQRYGEAKMLAFFTEVVRKRRTVDTAAQAVFGTPWQTVSTDATASVRAAAN
ncbi:hypothetical protein ACQEVZ_10820 [Dactylosporangium sp. CA-152071]|uniref:hypothetical protein n=1 Tax=Dactylosporangium sp. CA-152071 TaxID=3239933 RepID=UPI003D8C81D6